MCVLNIFVQNYVTWPVTVGHKSTEILALCLHFHEMLRKRDRFFSDAEKNPPLSKFMFRRIPRSGGDRHIAKQAAGRQDASMPSALFPASSSFSLASATCTLPAPPVCLLWITADPWDCCWSESHCCRLQGNCRKFAFQQKVTSLQNIARGTTDPGYWLRILSYL